MRDIIVRTVHDGDTFTADVLFGKLGRSEIWAHNIRLRLKDVRAYEIESDPSKQSETDRKIAINERNALSAALMAGDATPIRARLYHQTFDRYEAIVYSSKQCINELMEAYPQGGR